MTSGVWGLYKVNCYFQQMNWEPLKSEPKDYPNLEILLIFLPCPNPTQLMPKEGKS